MTQTWREFAIWADTNMDGLSVGSVDVTAEAGMTICDFMSYQVLFPACR